MSKRNIFMVLVLIGFIFYSCNGTKKTAASKQHTKPSAEKISLYDKPIDSLTTDYYSIDSVSMSEQALVVYVTYSGGCGEVQFDMFYKPQLMTVMPHRKTLLLKLMDNDPCRELIQKKLTYDLSIFNPDATSGGVLISFDSYEFMYTISEK